MVENAPLTSVLLRVAWIVPITTPPVRDGAVLVQGNRIAAVGKADDVRHHISRSTQRYDFPDGILLPGLVNSHTHLENTHFADQLVRPQPFADWIAMMGKLVGQQTYEEALTAARDGVGMLLRLGVTCIGDSSFRGAALQALRERGLRGIVFKELICPFDDELDKRWNAFVTWLDDAPTDENVRIGIMAHAPYTVTPTAFRKAGKLAAERMLPFSIHVAEPPDERALIERHESIWADHPIIKALREREVPLGLSPVRYLDWLGILRKGVILVHCVQVDDIDIGLLAERKVWVVHCPRSNANLQVGVMPLAKMLKAGVRVCLATDGLASAESLSPLDEIRFAMTLSESHPLLYPVLPPERWLRMVTLDAASALGLDGEIGSLKVGKRADLAVFPISQPVDDPYEAVLGEGRSATMTMVDGRIAFA